LSRCILTQALDRDVSQRILQLALLPLQFDESLKRANSESSTGDPNHRRRTLTKKDRRPLLSDPDVLGAPEQLLAMDRRRLDVIRLGFKDRALIGRSTIRLLRQIGIEVLDQVAKIGPTPFKTSGLDIQPSVSVDCYRHIIVRRNPR
jgi:hypothetical protein